MTELIDHPTGAFGYLPGGPAFSAGVVAFAGYQIVEWEFRHPRPLPSALDRVGRELEAHGLGWDALTGVDLRSPYQFDGPGFAAFNADYVTMLGEHYPLTPGALPPFTRTNIAPVEIYLSEPSVRAVQVVVPREGGGGDFVLSGVAEIRGAPTPEETIAFRDISEEGLRAKVDFVAAELALRVQQLGVSTADARIVDVYTAHQLDWLEPVLAGTFGSVAHHGLHRWLGRPPIIDLEFELGCKLLSGRVILD